MHVCRDCKNPLNTYPQKFGSNVVIVAECKTPGCLLKNVTLQLETLLNMSEEKAQTYRDMNRAVYDQIEGRV